MRELRVHLDGDRAHLGEVAAADIARLILAVERAMAQAAAVVLNQPKTTTGRYRGVIEQAVDLKLLGVEEGSVVPVLELPEAPSPGGDALELDVATLSESALEKLLDASDVTDAPDPLVAKALLEVAEVARVGDRYEAVTLDARNGRGSRKVRLDGEVRSRLKTYVDAAPTPPVRPNDLVGVLVEADFEKCSARLRTPTEPAVQVSFTEDLADDIHAALRQPTTLRGEVVYDPQSHTARSVALKSVIRGQQLALGFDAQEFWSQRSFEDLVGRYGGGKPVDPEDLYDPEATDEERDAFMAALAELG